MDAKESMLKLANQIIDDWHADSDNILKAEPEGLRLARAIKAFDYQAAAPGLLAACKAAQRMLLQTAWNGEDGMDIVNQAIAKAEGN